MNVSNGNDSAPEKRFRSIWDELQYLIRRADRLIFIRKNKELALTLLGRLEQVLSELRDADSSITRQEGLSLYHQLKGNLALAVEHRRKEIELGELLQKELRGSVTQGRLDRKTATRVLGRWNGAGLARRRLILQSLEADLQRERQERSS
jgi:hypothetical protein